MAIVTTSPDSELCYQARCGQTSAEGCGVKGPVRDTPEQALAAWQNLMSPALPDHLVVVPRVLTPKQIRAMEKALKTYIEMMSPKDRAAATKTAHRGIKVRLDAKYQARHDAMIAAAPPYPQQTERSHAAQPNGSLFRVEEREGGYEPQQRYTRGAGGGEFWFPLNDEGYWLEPAAFDYGIITKGNLFQNKAEAERVITKAAAICGQHLRLASQQTEENR